MVSLWQKDYSSYAPYQISYPPAFPWNREKKEDVPRYVMGQDGYWYDPQACCTGKALLSCTGDLMCEPRMMEACHYGDSYFFHPLFQYVRKILKGSDFSVGNLETTLTDCTPYAGEYHRIDSRYHCNAPQCYLDALRYGGFDAVVTANNHNCDSALQGITDTLDSLDRHGFMHTGLFRPEDRQRVLLVKINGIRVAVLAYASAYNKLHELHLTQAGVDTYLNLFAPEICKRDVEYARSRGAEFVLCYIHWGIDYDLEPGKQQLRILEQLKNCGMDYIVGSHTHCLQAHHVAVAEDGKRIPMIFSMGNFVTNESQELCKHTGILQLMLSRQGGEIAVREYFIPCYVYTAMGTGSYCVVPADGLLNGGIAEEKMPQIRAYVRSRIGPELEELPTGAITLEELCAAMGAQAPQGLSPAPIVKLAVQPWAACPKALYFSMGEPDALERVELKKRSVTALVSAEPVKDFPCILVPDVRSAYLAACAAVKARVPKVQNVLVAGPQGKTLTRELISHVLRAKGRVLTVRDGYQVDTAPWQELHPSHEYCVQELRPDHPMGQAAAVRAAAPQICVITGLLEELPALISALPDGSLLLLNGQDEVLMQRAKALDTSPIRVAFYGTEALECPGLPLPEMHPCAQAAYAVGRELGLEEPLLRQRIQTYRAQGYTQNVLQTQGLTLVLNLNCKSRASAVSAMEAMSRHPGRKLAVLGDPDGDLTGQEPGKLVETARKMGAQRVFAMGRLAKEPGLEAITPGDEDALEKAVLQELKEGDVVLLCGGRQMGFPLTLRRLFGLTDGFIPNR